MKKILAGLLAIALIAALALPASAATFTYTDQESGNQLTVPKDWDLEYVEDSLVKVQFTPDAGSAKMQYGSADLWSNMSAKDKKNLTRSDIDNSELSTSIVADMLGCKSSEVKRVTVSGTEYYRASYSKKQTGSRSSTDVTLWIRVDNGWVYLYQYAGSHSSDLYDDFEDMVGTATYGTSSSNSGNSGSSGSTGSSGSNSSNSGSSSSKSSDYDKAVKAYNKGSYYEAQNLFEDLNGYEDSDKYLRLIRIRYAGSNIGVGSDVYQSACGLTYSDMLDIDAAARDFYFADTPDVLLCNTDVACYYLNGKWNGGAYCYINFAPNDKGGWSYTIGSKLSTNYQGTFSINDNLLRVDVLGSNKLTLGLILLSPDCMEVTTFEKGNNKYVLNRE